MDKAGKVRGLIEHPVLYIPGLPDSGATQERTKSRRSVFPAVSWRILPSPGSEPGIVSSRVPGLVARAGRGACAAGNYGYSGIPTRPAYRPAISSVAYASCMATQRLVLKFAFLYHVPQVI